MDGERGILHFGRGMYRAVEKQRVTGTMRACHPLFSSRAVALSAEEVFY